jgi:UDP-glucose 4-epimerase
VQCLVVGGAGFLGAALVERLLAEGHAVDVVDDLSRGSLANLATARADPRADLRIHQVDVRTPEVAALVERRAPEVVFHLVPDADGEAADVADTVTTGGVRVLDAARRGGASRVVVVGSGRERYGLADVTDLPFREAVTPSPSSAVGAAFEALLPHLQWGRDVHGVEFTALALADVYGPGQRRGPVAELAAALGTGSPATVAGDPVRTLDLLYVDDAVDAVVRASQRGGGLVLHVGTGRETPLREVHRLLADAAGSPSAELAVVAPDRYLAPRFALDPGRARIHLGWSAWTPADTGLAALIR